MLNIFIGRDSLPTDKILITDVEAAFPLVVVTGTQFQKRVLSEIELGAFHNEKRFIDRFGGQLYYADMSTGSKALFEVDYLTNKVINCDECGENALSLLSLIPEGNVYLSRRDIAIPWVVDCPVVCNNKTWEMISLLNDLIG